ncbi:MAG: ParA family protein [Halobaculum sp.]
MPSRGGIPRFAVANAKGGVGKTTVSVTLAAALEDLGYDGVVIDADPQGSATEALGHLDAYADDPPTLLDALFADPSVTPDLLRHHEAVDLLPASIYMLSAEREFVLAELLATAEAGELGADRLSESARIVDTERVRDLTHPYALLDSVIAELPDRYDFVIVDCPPAHGSMLKNVFYAAPNLVVPATAESTSKSAVERLFDEVAAFERETDRSVRTACAFVNRIRSSTNESEQMIEYLEGVFADVPVYHVRERVAFSYAFDHGETIFQYYPTLDMCDVFRDAAETLAAEYLADGESQNGRV